LEHEDRPGQPLEEPICELARGLDYYAKLAPLAYQEEIQHGAAPQAFCRERHTLLADLEPALREGVEDGLAGHRNG
jgi:hypothetical protein